ncbi:MAG: hypothetical protein WAN46_22580 [Gammaproteobacteria bacterium]
MAVQMNEPQISEIIRKEKGVRPLNKSAYIDSLFRQGCMLYDLIPNMPEQRLHPLMQRFAELLLQQPTFNKVWLFLESGGMGV